MLDLRVWFLIRRARKGQPFQRLHAPKQQQFVGLFYSETETWFPVAMQSVALNWNKQLWSSNAVTLTLQEEHGEVDHLLKSRCPRAQVAADLTGRDGVNSGGTEPWLS